ncbi:MAG: hypothetical protein CYPHOPRED_003598 [Cyphobasidiales sp. Tagirdzhanova-0007]|nr:MAG: hypothetical protein CYPHOPRED_003598 [Cyphobasidiales sp. Tagirdzhanova-0007]
MLTVFFGERLGRKKTLSLGAILMTIGGTLQTSSFSVAQMIVARIISGLGMGMLNSTAPVLQSELAPKATRGRYISCNLTILSFGSMLAYWIDYASTHSGGYKQFAWRLPVGLQLVLTISIFCLSLIVVESPRWLCNHNRNEESLAVIASLMGTSVDDVNARERYQEIRDTVLYERSVGEARWSDLFKKDELGTRHRLWIACSIQGLQQLAGNNAVNYYGSYLFKNSLGFDSNLASLMSGFLFTWFFLSSFVPWFTLDTWGRKPLIIGSTAFMACLFAILSGTIKQVQNNAPNTHACGIVAAVCVFLYIGAFAIGFQATVWCVCAEIMPLRVRARGTALATATNWILNFAVVEFFPPAIANIGWRVYLVFLVMNAIVVPICYFTYIETKGKSLEEIDLLFGKGKQFNDVHQAKVTVADTSKNIEDTKAREVDVRVMEAA